MQQLQGRVLGQTGRIQLRCVVARLIKERVSAAKDTDEGCEDRAYAPFVPFYKSWVIVVDWAWALFSRARCEPKCQL